MGQARCLSHSFGATTLCGRLSSAGTKAGGYRFHGLLFTIDSIFGKRSNNHTQTESDQNTLIPSDFSVSHTPWPRHRSEACSDPQAVWI